MAIGLSYVLSHFLLQLRFISDKTEGSMFERFRSLLFSYLYIFSLAAALLFHTARNMFINHDSAPYPYLSKIKIK